MGNWTRPYLEKKNAGRFPSTQSIKTKGRTGNIPVILFDVCCSKGKTVWAPVFMSRSRAPRQSQSAFPAEPISDSNFIPGPLRKSSGLAFGLMFILSSIHISLLICGESRYRLFIAKVTSKALSSGFSF